MRDLLPCPPCGRQGRPGQGFLAGSNTKEPRGSAPRERDHRGGDHPVPSRTRQLSPPSPRVLQRKAAGGQGVALAEGAFLCLRASAREEMRGGAPHAPGGARGGMLPPAGLFCILGQGFVWCSSNLDAVILTLRYRRQLHALEALVRSVLQGAWRRAGRFRPTLFLYAPLPDSNYCWSLRVFMRTIISKLCTVHWRNAGVWECAIYDIGTALSALAGSDADLPKTVGESALRQALSSLGS